jgi:hypothetical protein
VDFWKQEKDNGSYRSLTSLTTEEAENGIMKEDDQEEGDKKDENVKKKENVENASISAPTAPKADLSSKWTTVVSPRKKNKGMAAVDRIKGGLAAHVRAVSKTKSFTDNVKKEEKEEKEEKRRMAEKDNSQN